MTDSPSQTFPISADQVQRPETRFWPLELSIGLLPFSLVAQVIVWAVYLPLGLHAYADFRQMYTGGYMIRTGQASDLYDFHAQQEIQRRLFPEASHMVLLITHPAFEELLFVPLSFLAYRSAFWVFFAMNLAALLISLWLLWPRISRIHEQWRWAPILLIASYFPVSRALLQGQDSILLLLLLSAALVKLEQGRHQTAGVMLGAGLFRFQIVLPIALLFLLWRNKRFAWGFLTSSFLATALSVATIGMRGAIAFLKYMLSISVNLNSDAAMTKFRDTPLEMLNLRGLISAVLWGRVSHAWIEVLILTTSVAMLIAAQKARPSLPFAIVTASLVSYHFIAHDASIWLIPIFCALSGPSIAEGAFAVLMLLSPFIAAFLFEGVYSHAYLASLPLLGLFLVQVCRRGGILASNGKSESNRATNSTH